MNRGKILSLALSCVFFNSFNANAAGNLSFFPLTNQAAGENMCLGIKSDGKNIFFSSCDNSAAQQWALKRTSSEYFNIFNKSDESKCLRTMANGTTVNLGTCSGDGYISMRSWTFTELSDGDLVIGNKYNNDLGRKQTLNNNQTVSMSTSSDDKQKLWKLGGEVPSKVRAVTGTKKVLLMATHFDGITPNDPASIRKAILGDGENDASLRNYLKQASFGKLNLEGTFLGNVNLGTQPTTCNSSSIIASAKEAALALGEDAANYDYIFVDISRTSACKWEGLAATPGNWIISNNVGHKVWMWSHEFGHNLGFLHSATLKTCPVLDGVLQLGNECSTGSSGDLTDTMGGGGSKIYPSNYLHYTTWLSDAEMPAISAPGVYNLYPLYADNMVVSTNSNGAYRGFRIKRSDGSVLILEYRQPKSGFESWEKDSPYVNGVIVRVMKYGSSTIQNWLVDTLPDTSTLADAPLMPEKSLYDTLSGKLITVVLADEKGAVIRVENR